MKFGLFYELQLPKPINNDPWDPDDERNIIMEMLDQVELADQLGISSPDFIRENLREYDEAHLDALIFIAQCGNRKHEDIMESIELFGKEVMPEFKERHETVHRKWRDEQLQGIEFPINSSI